MNDVAWDEIGVSWHASPCEEVRLSWEQIKVVCDLKRDCFSIDQIRITIGSDAGGWIEVTEDDAEFAELIAELPQCLPGCAPPEVWFQRVASPAMETRWTEIYRRANSSE